MREVSLHLLNKLNSLTYFFNPEFLVLQTCLDRTANVLVRNGLSFKWHVHCMSVNKTLSFGSDNVLFVTRVPNYNSIILTILIPNKYKGKKSVHILVE